MLTNPLAYPKDTSRSRFKEYDGNESFSKKKAKRFKVP